MKKFLVAVLIILLTVVGYLAFTSNVKKDIVKEKVENTVRINKVPDEYLEDNMFSDYSKKVYKKLQGMSLDEKIGQIFLVRYPDVNQVEALKKYGFGGYLFFYKDFKDKTKDEVIKMTKNLQENSKIPILTAVDEEGGIVVRVSKNEELRSERFLSPRDLYKEGGLERIKEDTVEKSNLLAELGLNLNLAPVVDISSNADEYMYERSLGEDTKTTSEFAKTVIEASKEGSVSYTLKHFPGYGNNIDTHTGVAVDNRSLEDIKTNDLPPFQEGIKAGAEAVLVSHNIVTSVDKDNPASLSKKVHDILINDLDFNGIVITDDLEMDSIIGDYKETIHKAVTSGNNLIIVTDYENSIKYVKELIAEKRIDEELINKLAFKIISWKYYKNML